MKQASLGVVLVAGALAACVMSHPPDDSSNSPPDQQPPPAPDAGTVAPGEGGSLSLDPRVTLPDAPAPVPDDPAACTGILPHPDLDPQPGRPCTEETSGGTATFRYDAAGRVIHRAVHTTYGYEAIYTSEDVGDTRTDTLTEHGSNSAQVQTRDVTRLKEGKPVEADHYKTATDGSLKLSGHTTWLYDSLGRQQYVISEAADGMSARMIERDLYDDEGRLYYVDWSQHWPGATIIVGHRWTSRSWFANGSLAQEIQTCDISGGPPCSTTEKRWDPCGNLTYSGNQTGNGRYSSFVDWSWDNSGRPVARHDRWNTTTTFFDSVESYGLDGAGRPASGAILTTNPPNYGSLPPTEQHSASYAYDEAGRVIDRSLDAESYNRADFHARFDAAGRLLERTGYNGNLVGRWRYDGCGR